MKTFKNIQEWVASNPSSDEMKRVLNFINKKTVSHIRKEFYQKENELRKLTKLQKGWKDMGLASNLDLEKSIKELTKVVEGLKNQLPPKRVIVRKVKKSDTEGSQKPQGEKNGGK